MFELAKEKEKQDDLTSAKNKAENYTKPVKIMNRQE